MGIRYVRIVTVALLLTVLSGVAWGECAYIYWYKVLSLRDNPPGLEESTWGSVQAFSTLQECQQKVRELGYSENQFGWLIKKIADRATSRAICLPDTVHPQ